MPFEQATKNLLLRLEQNPRSPETIQQFLLEFAEHVLWNSMPASATTIPAFEGLRVAEIARILPDMGPYQASNITPYAAALGLLDALNKVYLDEGFGEAQEQLTIQVRLARYEHDDFFNGLYEPLRRLVKVAERALPFYPGTYLTERIEAVNRCLRKSGE